MSGMVQAFAEAEVVYRAKVMRDTWGHLDAKPRQTYSGYIIFALSEYPGDGSTVVKVDFGDDTPGGPWFYEDLHEFVDRKCHPPYPRKSKGLAEGCIYRFDGTYMAFKNGKSRFSGKIKRVKIPGAT